MSVITAESASSLRPRSMWKEPATIHGHSLHWRDAPGGNPVSVMKPHKVTAKAMKTTPGPTRLTAPRPARCPRNRLNSTPSAGNSRIKLRAGKSWVMGQPAITSYSPAEKIEFVGVDGLAVAEHRDDNRESNGGLGGGDRHYEDDDDLTIHRTHATAERDERKVDRVEHQFDREEHDDHVAANEYAGNANREEDRAQRHVVGDRRHVRRSPDAKQECRQTVAR